MTFLPESDGLPVVARVDVLVLGGTAAGVAFALEAARRGASVFLAGAAPYLGEDVAGELRLWPDAEPDPLLYPDAGRPVVPLALKRSLEGAMAAAKVPFLLNAIPAGGLADASGRIVGARLATRSGLLAVLAGIVVDASTGAGFAASVGLGGIPRPRGAALASQVVLALPGSPEPADLPVAGRPGTLEGTTAGKAWRLEARRHAVEVDLGDGSPFALARAERRLRLRAWVPGQFAQQDRPAWSPVPDTGWERTPGPARIPGLVVLGPACPEAPLPVSASSSVRAARARVAPVLAAGREAGPGGMPVSVVLADPGDPAPEGFRFPDSLPATRVVGRMAGLHGTTRFPELGRCDVLVVGGGTGGAPAAIAAGRAGARVVVVEALPVLGGVGTAGQIARYWFGNKVGFTAEMDRGVAALEVDPDLAEGSGSWSPQAKSRWLEERCAELGVTVLARSLACGALVEDGRVRGLVVATPWGCGLVRAGCVVDATGCADVAAMVGAPTRSTAGDHVAVQGTGLAGVDPAKPYHNSDHGFCDDTDVFDATAFLVAAKERFRDHVDAGQLVDTRERRQIVGELELGPCDFLAGRRYPDTISVASSNFDSHGFTVHPLFACKPPTKVRLWADVPLRALLPRGIERLLVTGLGLSAHRDVLPVVRMQADVQNHGYAAGLAAALAALGDRDLRALDVRALQRRLVEVGILPERVLGETDNFPPPDGAIDDAVKRGWDDHRGLALLFADPSRSLPRLRAAWLAGAPGPRRLRHALVLALLDDPTGAPDLLAALADAAWDDGWDYRGMHQFGMSASPVDVLLTALGRVGDASAWPVVARLADALGPDAAFSHVRAVAECCEALHRRHPSPLAAALLARLLALPGFSAHATTDLGAVLAAVNDDPCDNLPRNLALRELHVARALFRCGDPDGRGRGVLEAYARDLRGHFARHALAVLAE